MLFSPIPAARCHYLLDLLAQVPDPRKRRGRRHPLAGLLAAGIAAVIAGARSVAAVGEWAADARPEALAVDEKSKETPGGRELLKAFTDLAGAVVTIDAMHTQHDTAQAILSRGAGYVMTVKANMPTLYRQLKKLPWTAVPAVSAVSTDHGRRARRTIKAVLAPAWTGFAGAAQVAQLRRTVTRNGKQAVEAVDLITSARDADPAP